MKELRETDPYELEEINDWDDHASARYKANRNFDKIDKRLEDIEREISELKNSPKASD